MNLKIYFAPVEERTSSKVVDSHQTDTYAEVRKNSVREFLRVHHWRVR